MDERLKAIGQEMDRRYATGQAYDRTLAVDQARGRALREAVLSLLDEQYGRPLSVPTVEIGCGDGDTPEWLWPAGPPRILCPPTLYFGIDISHVAVERACDRRPEPWCSFLTSPIETLFDPRAEFMGAMNLEGMFGVALAVESIEHWSDVDAGLESVRRLLEPRGTFILTTPNRDSLHCRIGRKLGVRVPTVSPDHVHEFGYVELITKVEEHGFVHERACGAGFAPYWALEQRLGDEIRRLTDHDQEVNTWLNDIGRFAPAQYAFCQCHRFRKV